MAHSSKKYIRKVDSKTDDKNVKANSDIAT